MLSFRMFMCALALTVLAVTAEASSGGGIPNYTYELSGSALTQLFNSPVYKAERMRRPLDGSTVAVGDISHSGVRLTLADDTKWLIHKGRNFGISTDIVVVNARHMRPTWKVIQTKNFNGRKTISELLGACNTEYKLLSDNCHKASRCVMRQ